MRRVAVVLATSLLAAFGLAALLSEPGQRANYDRTRLRPPTTSRSPVLPRTPRRGVIELSPAELRHLAYRQLTLTDGHGRLIMLPAGTGHGDEITLRYHDGPDHPTPRKDLTETD